MQQLQLRLFEIAKRCAHPCVVEVLATTVGGDCAVLRSIPRSDSNGEKRSQMKSGRLFDLDVVYRVCGDASLVQVQAS